jgi:pimeloyl-ACP methyl ester carboxylesterase
MLVPEGLTLIDSKGEAPRSAPLNCDKPTLIFLHGWSPEGASSTVAYPDAWNAAFNVFVFRWHRDSYSRITPFAAENRVPAARARLDAQVAELLTRLGGDTYAHEIRVVAHSLGAQLALPLLRGRLNAGVRKPRRLELLDPYLWIDMRRHDALTGQTLPHEHVELLRGSRILGVKAVVYAASVTSLISRTLRDVTNVQVMHPGWLSGNPSARHMRLVEYYFGSLRFEPPSVEDPAGSISKGFSASLPSAEFPTMKVLLEQIDNGSLNEEQVTGHAFRRLGRENCARSVWEFAMCI